MRSKSQSTILLPRLYHTHTSMGHTKPGTILVPGLLPGWVYPGTISLKGRLYNFTLHGPSFLSKQIKGLKVTDFTLCRLKDILVWYQIECFDFKTWRSNILEFSAYRYFGENREYHVTQVKLLAAINRMNQDLGCIKDPHLPFMVHNPKAVFC